jgi:uncharacterized protein
MHRIILAGFLASLTASAGANIVITEIWQGVDGPDHTGDWFELTNFDNVPFDASDIYFDDNSFDPTQSAKLNGISSIAPGESVIFVEGDANAITTFRDIWFLDPGVQVGNHSGAGLSQGGDAVNIYDTQLPGALNYASQAFGATNEGRSWIWNPDTQSWNDELASVGVFGAYESGLGGAGFPAVGSPGVVPAPAAGALLALAGITVARRRR